MKQSRGNDSVSHLTVRMRRETDNSVNADD